MGAELHVKSDPSHQELQELLEHGDAAKRRAATAMNERSTRAHTVFVLSLQAWFAQYAEAQSLEKLTVL